MVGPDVGDGAGDGLVGHDWSRGTAGGLVVVGPVDCGTVEAAGGLEMPRVPPPGEPGEPLGGGKATSPPIEGELRAAGLFPGTALGALPRLEAESGAPPTPAELPGAPLVPLAPPLGESSSAALELAPGAMPGVVPAGLDALQAASGTAISAPHATPSTPAPPRRARFPEICRFGIPMKLISPCFTGEWADNDTSEKG